MKYKVDKKIENDAKFQTGSVKCTAVRSALITQQYRKTA